MEPRNYTDIYKKFENKWVAFNSEPFDSTEVVGSGNTLDEALKQAARKGFKDPVVTKFPSFKYTYALNQ